MSTYKVGDEFDVKPGTKETDWPACGHGGTECLPGCVSMKILSIKKDRVHVVLGSSPLPGFTDPLCGFNIEVKPFEEYIKLGLLIPRSATAKVEKGFSVGDTFDIKPGVTEEEWRACGMGLTPSASVYFFAHLSAVPTKAEILRVDDSDHTYKLELSSGRRVWVRIPGFSLAVDKGYFIPRGAASSTATKTRPNNKHNSGLCPCCGTQTVSFSLYSGFVSKDFICPKCKE